MPPRSGHPWRGLAAAAVLVVAACSDSTGPQAHLASPEQLSADLQSVAGVVTSPAFASFAKIGTAAGSPAAVSTPAGALLQAGPITPPRTSSQPYADAPRRLAALRAAGVALGSTISASVIPSQYLGQTFVWDDATHQYVVGPDAGPSNGVRIILYALDPLTDQVAEPSNAVGYVDLLDQSNGGTNALEVLLNGGTPASPGTTYAHYTITGSVTGNPPTTFTATASGFVSDGTRTLTFDATFSGTNLTTDNPDVDFQVTWDLNDPAVHIELHETLATSDANHVTISVHFSVTRGTETISVDGTITEVVSPLTVTADLHITVGGVPYADVVGTNQGIELRHHDGSALSATELQAVSDLFEMPDNLSGAMESLVNPCQHMLGA